MLFYEIYFGIPLASDPKCEADCAMRSLRFIGDDGKYGPGSIKLIELKAGGKPLSNDVYTKCASIVNNRNIIFDVWPSKCDGKSLKFAICIAMYFFNTCPADKKVNDSFCSKIHSLIILMKTMMSKM